MAPWCHYIWQTSKHRSATIHLKLNGAGSIFHCSFDPFFEVRRWHLNILQYHLLQYDMADSQYSPPLSGEETEKAQPQAKASRRKLLEILATTFGVATLIAIGDYPFPLSLPDIVPNDVPVVSLSVHFALKKRSTPLPLSITGPSLSRTVSIHGPVIATNFADPAIIEVDGTYYTFATNKFIKPHQGQVNIQIATSKDFVSWNLTDVDALPDTGNWTTHSFTWAPDVVQVDDGFVMYYSGRVANAPKHHCIGAAKSPTIMGPYEPLPAPLACPLPQVSLLYPFRESCSLTLR